MKYLAILFAALFVHIGSVQPADARRGGGVYGYGETLEFVAPTNSTAANGAAMALCAHIRTHHILFIDVWRAFKGYALAENRCYAEGFVPVSAASLAQLKAKGDLSSDVPEMPDLKTGLVVPMWAWAALATLIGLGVLKTRRRSKRRKARQSMIGDVPPTVSAILDAMCHAAKVDGKVSHVEVEEIANAATTMTGEKVSVALASRMALMAESKLEAIDYRSFVKGLTPADHEVMMYGVLLVVAADGRLEANEKTFVGRLALQMNMSSDKVDELVRKIAAEKMARPAE